MSNLRVGLIGLGVMGKNHARILSNLSRIDFIGVADPIEAAKVSNFGQSTKFFQNYEDLLSQNLDYCVIAAPTGLHKEIAISTLNAGSHCLIEKPIAVNYSEALEIQEVAQAKSRIVGIGHVERYNPAIRELKKKLIKGDLGEIYQISIRRQGPFPARIADVGVVKDLATHDIDLISWLTGSNFVNVNAEIMHRSGRDHEDLVSINGKLNSGIIFNLLVNWLSPLKERSIVVSGKNGAFVVDTLNSDLTFYENGSQKVSQDTFLHFKGVTQGNITTFAFEKPEPLLIEHENFRDMVLGKEAEIITLSEGIETVRVADAVIESGMTSESIKL